MSAPAALDPHTPTIDTQTIPGTIHLVDLEHTLHTKHARGKGQQQDIVLVPTPSDDFDDPLNWSRARKWLSTSCWVVYTLANGIANSSVYSVEVPLARALGITTSVLNAGTGYLFLLAGWGLLFWQPVALQYGKRPVYLVSTLGTLALSMWSPYAESDGQWYAKCILGGFFSAPIEALPELSVTDVYFAHERGTYMAIYGLTLVGSNFLAPVICGFINEGQGYRWVFYWPSIFCAVGFIFMFFFMEETNYDRKTVGLVLESDGSSASAIATPVDTEKAQTSIAAAPLTQKKGFWQKMALWDGPRPMLIPYRIILSLRLTVWPCVFYAGFAYGSTLIWFNVLNATASIIFSAAPYEFGSGIVGLTYVACLIGVGLATLFAGRISDWFAIKLSRRNGGVMEPEYRLWLMASTTLMVPFGLLLWGVGAAHGVNWFGLCFAMAVLGFVNTVGATVSVNYLVDCYRELSGDALTSVILIRNTMSFAIGYGITPWLDNLGTQNCFISAAFVGMAASLAFVPMIIWGKQFRERSRAQYWELVRKGAERGALH